VEGKKLKKGAPKKEAVTDVQMLYIAIGSLARTRTRTHSYNCLSPRASSLILARYNAASIKSWTALPLRS